MKIGDLCYETYAIGKDYINILKANGYVSGKCPTSGAVGYCNLWDNVQIGTSWYSQDKYYYNTGYNDITAQQDCQGKGSYEDL